MRKQLYMQLHLKNLDRSLNSARNSQVALIMQAGTKTRIRAELFMTYGRRWERWGKKRYCIIWMFIWIMLLICWPKLTCLNTEVQLQSQADCNETSVLTMHDKSHWPDSGFTRHFFSSYFSVNLSLLLLSRVWDDSHSVDGKCRCV